MALKITLIDQKAVEPMVRVSERVWVTAARDRVVPEGHEEAAFLLAGPEDEIPRREAERLGLLAPDEPTTRPARGKAAARPADKQARAEGDKAPS